MSDTSPTQHTTTARGVAALCSFFVPGLGQLVQGRVLLAILFFLGSLFLYCCCLGWIPHAWSVIDAALWQPRQA
jgi:TM2 domain-containing membrane protein YozV